MGCDQIYKGALPSFGCNWAGVKNSVSFSHSHILILCGIFLFLNCNDNLYNASRCIYCSFCIGLCLLINTFCLLYSLTCLKYILSTEIVYVDEVLSCNVSQ